MMSRFYANKNDRSQVKVYYVWWLPFGARGMAPFPRTILLHRSIRNLEFNQRQSTIIHERTHIKQIKRDGYRKWLKAYFFDGRQRALYEAEAYGAQIKFLWVQGKIPNLALDKYVARVAENIVVEYFWPKRKWFGTAPKAGSVKNTMIGFMNGP